MGDGEIDKLQYMKPESVRSRELGGDERFPRPDDSQKNRIKRRRPSEGGQKHISSRGALGISRCFGYGWCLVADSLQVLVFNIPVLGNQRMLRQVRHGMPALCVIAGCFFLEQRIAKILLSVTC